jgi:hypothetical protein
MPKNILSFVSPAILDPKAAPKAPPAPEEPALSLLAFSGTGFVPVTQVVDPGGPNNVGGEKDGKNPAGPVALSSVKDVLTAGEYQHPIHGWKLNVTPDKMDKYCAAFSEMTSGGVKVPIYADHKPGAATTLGYCRALFRGGADALKKYPELAKLPADQAPLDSNKMYAIHDWNSPESMKMGHGVGQVSVLIDKKMKDGTGKSYGEAVRHIAVTPEPIVPGQGGFTQLAASMLKENTGLYALSTLEFGGPGSGRHPEGTSGAAMEATQKANKLSEGDDHKAASDAHFAAATAHNAAMMQAPNKHVEELHRKQAELHTHLAFEHAKAGGHKESYDRLSAYASPSVMGFDKADGDDDGDEDGDSKAYPKHKKNAEKSGEKAHKSGESDHHADAAMAHKTAAMSAPSPEEKKAHMDCAADHFRAAARAVQMEGQTDAEKKASDIRQGEREKAAKNGNHYFDRVNALASPEVLSLSR